MYVYIPIKTRGNQEENKEMEQRIIQAYYEGLAAAQSENERGATKNHLGRKIRRANNKGGLINKSTGGKEKTGRDFMETKIKDELVKRRGAQYPVFPQVHCPTLPEQQNLLPKR